MYTDDTQAISAVLKGDRSSYESLVDKHKKMVYGIAWSHLGDSDLSEDAAQETFVKAYTYLGTLREPDKFAGWLARIARNVCSTFRRSAKRERAFKERWAVLESAETEQRADERESLSEPLWESFADLPAVHREALTAFYIEDRNVTDAAAALGITESALKTRLHRARTALRDQLEHRLEESLGELRPSKTFTRSVLFLLPLSPKGALATGLAATFTKAFASLSLAVWFAAAGVLPVIGIYSLMARTDESGLADTPQSELAKTRIRRGYRNAAIGMFVSFVVTWTLMDFIGHMTMFQVLAVIYGAATLLVSYSAIRQRRFMPMVSTVAIVGNVLVMAIMFVAMAAIAFFDAPMVTFAAGIFVVSLVAAFTTPKTPMALRQFGCNLFLQAAANGGAIPEIDQPLERRLTQLELRTFAKLLSGVGLVSSYRVREGSLSLVLPSTKGSPLALFGIISGDSAIRISSDGACNAVISDTDLNQIRQSLGAATDAVRLQDGACRAVRYALHCFARGEAQSGLDAISVRVDESAFAQSPTSTRNHRAKMLASVAMGAAVLAAFASQSAILMVVYSLGGFAAAALILAANLYITRRQTRSL